MKLHLYLVCCFLLLISGSALALNDSRALNSLQDASVIYDVRTAEAKKLNFILKVISDTREGMLEQGVKGDVIISMRGPTVKLLVADSAVGTAEERAGIKAAVESLTARGVRLEACGYALNLFALDPQDLINGVTPIGNSLVSLIGYQNKGYAFIPMN